GYVVADPLDPDLIIGGKLTRFDRRTGQAQNILPVPVETEDFRMLRTEPVIFSLLDPHLLFFAGNTLWQTRDRGDHWEKISPDLSRPNYELPASIGKYKEDATKQAHRRGGNLHRCPVTARREQNLVRNRRRFDAFHDRRRKNLEQCDAIEH